MIQLREDLAWVSADDGRLTPFDADRLIKSIEQACEFAGHADRLLAESVAAAVEHYALECESDHTIAAAEISRIVLAVLRALACEDIAHAYARRREWTEIRLDQISGFELEFYRQLDEALRAASGAEETARMQLRGLRACVMRLRHARRWGTSCRALADEIVEFVRARVARSRPASAGALRMEVLE
jgi:hypothetical protein